MAVGIIYIAVAVIILLVIALLVFFNRKDKGQAKLTPLAGLAFAFVLAGLFFGESRIVGYSLMGVGVILAIVDMVNKSRKK